MNRSLPLALAACLVVSLLPQDARASRPAAAAPPAAVAPAVAFEPNAGRFEPRALFWTRAGRTRAFVARDAIVVRGADRGPALELRFPRAASRVEADRQLRGRSHYLDGRDPSRWRTNVARYGRVRCEGIAPGVDAVVYGRDGRVEYDLVARPGADLAGLWLDVAGAERLALAPDGAVVAHLAGAEVRQPPPVAYQEIGGGRRAVASRYEVDGIRLRVRVGAYDPSLPLVVDPELGYSTYFGGSGGDLGHAVAADAQGFSYVAGETGSGDGSFFLMNPLQETSGGANEAAIASVAIRGNKLTATGERFTSTVSVFVDGIPFVAAAKVKKGNTRVIQKGNLLVGQPLGQYVAARGGRVQVAIRNSEGGVATFEYEAP